MNWVSHPAVIFPLLFRKKPECPPANTAGKIPGHNIYLSLNRESVKKFMNHPYS